MRISLRDLTFECPFIPILNEHLWYWQDLGVASTAAFMATSFIVAAPVAMEVGHCLQLFMGTPLPHFLDIKVVIKYLRSVIDFGRADDIMKSSAYKETAHVSFVNGMKRVKELFLERMLVIGNIFDNSDSKRNTGYPDEPTLVLLESECLYYNVGLLNMLERYAGTLFAEVDTPDGCSSVQLQSYIVKSGREFKNPLQDTNASAERRVTNGIPRNYIDDNFRSKFIWPPMDDLDAGVRTNILEMAEQLTEYRIQDMGVPASSREWYTCSDPPETFKYSTASQMAVMFQYIFNPTNLEDTPLQRDFDAGVNVKVEEQQTAQATFTGIPGEAESYTPEGYPVYALGDMPPLVEICEDAYAALGEDDLMN